MQKITKIFGVLAAAAVGLSLATGCNPEPEKNKKTFKVAKWEDTVASTGAAKDASFVATSVNGSAYVSIDGNKSIYQFDGKKWSAPIVTTALNAVGTAKTDISAGAPVVSYIAPSSKGAVASISGITDREGGVLYIKEALPEFAGVALNAGFTNSIVKEDQNITSYVVSKGNDEYVVAIGADKSTGIGKLGDKLTFAIKLTGGSPVKDSKFISVGDSLYAVSATGVDMWANFDPTKALTAAADVKTADDLGSDKWKIDLGVANSAVKAITASGNNIYIGLTATKANEGGVAIIDTVTKTAMAPNATWSNVSVLGFAKNGNDIYAVTATGLFKVEIDTKKVKKGDDYIAKINGEPAYDAKAKYADLKDGATYLDGAKGPVADITGAAFVDNKLLVATSSAGISILTLTDTKKEE